MQDAAKSRSLKAAFREIGAVLRIVVDKGGAGALVWGSALMLAAGLSEGLALLLLVPLLQAIDPAASGGAAASSGVVRIFTGAFNLQPTLAIVLMLFLGVALSRAFIARQKSVELLRLQLKLIRDIRIDLYRSIAEASWSFLRRTRVADYQAALTSEIDRLATAVHFALELPSSFVMISMHILVAGLISPGLTLAAIAVGVVIAWFVRGRLVESLRLGERLSDAYTFLHRQISEFLAGLKITKSFGAERSHVRAFTEAVVEVDQRLIDYSRSSANARLLQDIAAAFAVAIFLWISVAAARLPMAQVLVLALVFYRLLPLLQAMQQSAQELLHTSAAAHTVLALSQRCAEAREAASAETVEPLRMAREISFANVSFRHEADAGATLDDISFVLPAGGLTLLIGASGAGKSTLLDVLAGLLPPEEGKLCVDGKAIEETQLSRWRQAVAYVSQEAFLFHDTIRANLCLAKPGADDADLEAALAAAGALDFVRRLPNGFDALVGDRGSRLSGGERQRLAIARALLRKPALLILDEPTNALDAVNEDVVLESIRALRGRMTIVLVTHRPEKILDADQILRIDAGRLETPARVA